MPPRPLTKPQRELLVDVQFKRRVLAGRDTLYGPAASQHANYERDDEMSSKVGGKVAEKGPHPRD